MSYVFQVLIVCLSIQIIYQCTFPGCRQSRDTVRSIESHVRAEHLQRPEEIEEDDEEDEEDRDHEEEFYYTEIEADTGKRNKVFL